LLILYYGAVFSTWGESYFKVKDSGKIVIDEIAGVMITMWGFQFNYTKYDIVLLVIGFILFRIFDIVKPYPINKLQDISGGWGVMLDDIAAGVVANVLMQMIVYFKIVSFFI
jgi:phosphatidylglycerophosphatase A